MGNGKRQPSQYYQAKITFNLNSGMKSKAFIPMCLSVSNCANKITKSNGDSSCNPSLVCSGRDG